MIIYEKPVAAQLRRSLAPHAFVVDHSIREVIGEGPLWKMVRAALTDPDGELWRYSIAVGGEIFRGNQIQQLSITGPSWDST